jgi:ATP-binding cassette subfamily B protein/subfamily B ATP-binding cassette protein MsbA
MKVLKRYPALLDIFLGEHFKNFWPLVIILLSNLIYALMENISFGCILTALTFLANKTDNPFQALGYFSQVFSFENYSRDKLFIFFVSLSVVAQIIRSLIGLVGQLLAIRLGTRIQARGQQIVYQQIFRFSFAQVHRFPVGELVECAKIPASITMQLLDYGNRVLTAAATIVGSLVFMCSLSPSLTLFAVVMFGILGISQKKIIRTILTISEKLTDSLAEFSQLTIEGLYGIRLIHTFHRQQFIVHRIRNILDKIVNVNQRMHSLSQAVSPINEVLGVLIVGFFLYIGDIYILSNEPASLPILLTFVLMIYRTNVRLQNLAQFVALIASLGGALTRLEHFLSPHDKEFLDETANAPPHFTHSIAFNQVSFQYPGTQRFALSNIHLTIPKNQTLAIVGPSGAGKSSLIDLFLGLYPPTQGAIQIDGQPLSQISLEKWRNLIGVVSQDALIFNQTIEENIRFGKLDASEAEIRAAAQIARVDEFVRKLPHGYQTVVGEKGYRLSGGEKQRIALARALIRNAPILLLDEATSNLDTENERWIQEAIQNLGADKTIIIVAHRLSTIAHVDQIVVLEGGEIVEVGSHLELIAKGGRYAQLANLQTA